MATSRSRASQPSQGSHPSTIPARSTVAAGPPVQGGTAMLSVQTNTAALNAYRNLSRTQDQMNTSMQRLSSGYRINSAADDAAGLAISTQLGSQISGLTQAVRNTQDGISVVQTASGALNETTAILQRMRDLSVQAANDSNSSGSRTDITTEVTQLTAELNRIASTTAFNGNNLLDGTAGGGSGTLNFQVGADVTANDQIAVDLSGANLTNIVTTMGTLDLTSSSGAQAAITSIDTAISSVS